MRIGANESKAKQSEAKQSKERKEKEKQSKANRNRHRHRAKIKRKLRNRVYGTAYGTYLVEARAQLGVSGAAVEAAEEGLGGRR